MADTSGVAAGARTAAAASQPARLDALLQQILVGRKLTIADQAAWQILHGSLAYGRAFPVETESGIVSASDYVLAGGAMQGWDPVPGDSFGDPPRRTIRLQMDPGAKVGQGHRDQWLAILSQCGYPLDQPVTAGGITSTLDDLVQQALWDIPRNVEREYSWTLLVLANWHDSDHTWKARDGRQWSVADLVHSECHQDLEQSACGGTHRLIGLATIVQKRKSEGKRLGGVWSEAEQLVTDGLRKAEANQNADGSACTTFLHRPGWSADLTDVLRTTGHVLEFVAVAAPDETLAEPWVTRSVDRLSEVLELTQSVPLECGALYHAVHGLVLYRQRRYGSLEFELPEYYREGERVAAKTVSSL